MGLDSNHITNTNNPSNTRGQPMYTLGGLGEGRRELRKAGRTGTRRGLWKVAHCLCLWSALAGMLFTKSNPQCPGLLPATPTCEPTPLWIPLPPCTKATIPAPLFPVRCWELKGSAGARLEGSSVFFSSMTNQRRYSLRRSLVFIAQERLRKEPNVPPGMHCVPLVPPADPSFRPDLPLTLHSGSHGVVGRLPRVGRVSLQGAMQGRLAEKEEEKERAPALTELLRAVRCLAGV